MPPKKKAVAVDVQIKSCNPMQQFSGAYVVYLQLDRRPPDSVLEVLRGFGFYRKGPGGGAGWHIPIEKATQCAQAIRGMWPDLSQRMAKCAKEIKHNRENVPCPSKVKGLSITSKPAGKRKYTSVSKV